MSRGGGSRQTLTPAALVNTYESIKTIVLPDAGFVRPSELRIQGRFKVLKGKISRFSRSF